MPRRGDTVRSPLPRDMSSASTVPAMVVGTICREAGCQSTQQMIIYSMSAEQGSSLLRQWWEESGRESGSEEDGRLHGQCGAVTARFDGETA